MTSMPEVALLSAILLGGGFQADPAGPPAGSERAPPSATASSALYMRVDIWPEYDDPRVLVIYRGVLDPAAAVPADFSVAVPAGARIHMAGAVDPEGRHLHAEYETRERTDGLLEVSWKLPVPDFYMEFYYDPVPEGEERRFMYPVLPTTDVERLMVNVQQPLRSEGFQVTPFTPSLTRGDDGFLYHVIERDSVAAESLMPISVRYRKENRKPSVASAAGAVGDERGGDDGGGILEEIVALAAVILVGTATYGVFARSLDDEEEEDAAEAGSRSTIREDGAPEEPERRIRYCTSCGSPYGLEARFCSLCGAATARMGVAGPITGAPGGTPAST